MADQRRWARSVIIALAILLGLGLLGDLALEELKPFLDNLVYPLGLIAGLAAAFLVGPIAERVDRLLRRLDARPDDPT